MFCSIFILVQFSLLNILSHCDAYKILVISSVPSRSHAILGDALVRHLTKAGHEVTYVTSMPKDQPWLNVTQVDVGDKIRPILKDVVNLQKIIDKKNDVIDMRFLIKLMHGICVMTLEHKKVHRLMTDPRQQFDLIIGEWMYSDIYAGLAAIYGCPIIWFLPVEPHWTVLKVIDEAPNPAYYPDIVSPNVPPFSFLQRLQELSYQMSILAHQFLISHPRESSDYERIIAPIVRRRGRSAPSFEELKYNVSLILGNSHVSLGLPISLPQNYKPIAGFHIAPDVKPLPQDLQKIMDLSINGVIYFSLGSYLESKELPMSIKTGLLKMFSELKQTIIWKFEEDLSDGPANVHVVPWAPQTSILAHPNCVLFITHGGYVSSTESVHFGVPLIGVPVYGDQFNNIDRAVRNGYALRVNLSYTMADNLRKAIDEILTDPKYKEEVKEVSFMYHDRPVSPGDELVHWVQHVVRTRGASHLRSLALHVPWYQKMYLDLVAVVYVELEVFKFIQKKLLCMF